MSASPAHPVSVADDMLQASGGSTRWRLIAYYIAGFLACWLATLFPIVFGRVLWPEGLGAGTETLFWPTTGVTVAGLLLLGPRFALWSYAATVLGVLCAGRSLGWSCFSSLGNLLEGLLAWWIITRPGKYAGRFNRMCSVGALIAASVVAPLISALSGTLGLVYRGIIPAAEFPAALLVWTLANGASLLILTPFITAIFREEWSLGRRPWEALAWLVPGWIAVALGLKAFLSGGSMNFAFLAFPFTIYAAVRFGPAESAGALFLVMASIYWALSRYSPEWPAVYLPPSIWFVQTFCWTLGAMALMVAALVHERHDAQTHALEASLREEQARLAALRYQINPHFLFNTLNSLRATLPPDADTSRQMVTALAGYLRATLQTPESQFTTLRAELEGLSHYLAIERTRFAGKLDLVMEIAPEAPPLRIPVFLLQPLVENAIIHGFQRSRKDFRIVIRAQVEEDDRLAIEVANTGVWNESDVRARRGIGLSNIRQRLRLLYSDRADFLRESADGWVRITLRIPALPADPTAIS